MRAETGLNAGTDFNLLKNPNPGIWYHNLLWGQLNEGAMFDPGYWYSEHLDQINQIEIAKPFWDFVKGLDLNKGGYVTLGSSSTNNNLRVFGQKNLSKNKAHIWVQNATHTWKKVMDNTTSAQSGTVSVTLNPTTNYSIETWNTYAGTTTTQTMQSDSTGKLTLQITNLADDTAFKITGPVATPIPSSGQVKRGDIDGNNKVDIHDYSILLTNFGKSFPGVQGDIDNTGKVDIHDYNILLTNFGR
jgi:hypothetical protein